MTQTQFLRALGIAAVSALALSACTWQETRTETVTTTSRSADNPDAVFMALDTNRDGFLSRGELDVLVGSAPGPAESPEMVFRRLDVNNDGFLSRAEASAVINTIPGATFDQMDQNRDGFLSLGEMQPHMTWYASRYPIYSWFDALDTNKDGFLTRAEAAPLLGSARLSAGRWTVSPWPPVGVTVVPPSGAVIIGPRY